VCVQRVPAHEAELAREGVSRAARSRAAHRDARGAARAREDSDRPDAGAVVTP
jgi:hypothetical protein